MNKTCIVVADAKLARFYDVEEVESPRLKMKLVERTVLTNNVDLKSLGESVTGRARTETNTDRGSGPIHPMVAQRELHGVELERRFGQDIVRQVKEITRSWKDGVVMLVAEPQLLGLMREPLRKALHQGIELKELAKDYTHLAVPELHDRISLSKLIPAHRGAAS